MDREKVIKGLERCQMAYECKPYEKCPYSNGLECGDCDINRLHYDALALLKEQDETIKELQNAYGYLQKQFFDVQDELLKEQEAVVPGGDSGMCEICSFYERALSVKPHYNARTNWYECGACHYSMTSGMHCKGELIPAYKVGFCAKCGKAVMWG